jgi:hypothetical protein
MREAVLWVLTVATTLLDLPMPDAEGLDLGEEHEAVAAQYGGHLARRRGEDGAVHPIPRVWPPRLNARRTQWRLHWSLLRQSQSDH